MGRFKKFKIRDKIWFKEKIIGTALISAAGGMVLIILLPKFSLGILLAFVIFLFGLWVLCCC